MAGAKPAALALLGTSVLGAQPTPLFAVELLADACGRRHDVALLVFVRRRRLRSSQQTKACQSDRCRFQFLNGILLLLLIEKMEQTQKYAST